MPDAFTGFTSGFTASRDEQIKRNADREAANRAMADKMFSFLLASRDPQMQELALRGMSTPSNPKKGLAGYFGQMDSPHDPIYQQVIARMNEMIPDEDGGPPRSSAPTPSAGPGSAAMSTNAPVQSGSAPIQLPGQQLEMPPSSPPPPATDTSSGVSAAMPPDLEGMGGPPAMPMGNPESNVISKFKRRGTGVPTAEEIAEMQARVPLETRIKVATEQLQRAGATPQEFQRVLQDILTPGSPQRQPVPSAMTQWGARINGVVQPVIFDPEKPAFVLSGGQPLPLGAEMVRMSGAAAGGAALSSRIPDTPEGRQYLIAQGADPAEVSAGSPTGYWKVITRPDGTVGVQADIFVPPPVYSSTPTILDQSGTSTVMGVTRGGAMRPLGTAPSPQNTAEQSTAASLMAVVRARVAAHEAQQTQTQFGGITRYRATPAEIDGFVREAAAAQQLPYVSYFQLEQATRIPAARQVAPRADAPAAGSGPTQPPVGGAAKVAQRAREIEAQSTRGRAVPFGAPPAAPPPGPQRPPTRGRGAGPAGQTR